MWLFALAAIIIAGYFAATEGQAIVSKLTGHIPADEDEILVDTAIHYGLDVDFLRAIRLTENGPTVTAPSGGRTRGMGIIDFVAFPSAKTFYGQVQIAAQTVKHTLQRFRDNIYSEPIDENGHYTTEFMRYFSWGGPGYAGYAAIGVDNDPTGLNANHFPNLTSWYARALGPDTVIS